jgi:transposase
MFLGRAFSAEEIAELELAEKGIRDKKGYRRLQCLLLRAKQGKAAWEIAEILGIAQRTVEGVQSRYFKEGLAVLRLEKPGPQGPRNMSLEEEAQLLRDFEGKAEAGQLVTLRVIRLEYESRLGRQTSESTIYRLLHRHGWRKVKPRPRHPKGKPDEQTLFKKIPGNNPVSC